ncbi:MAG: 50S ribosomal protein L1 [Candidatus Woesearchaeota archaeon]
MEKLNVKDAIKKLREHNRNFSQSFDLIVNLRDLNMKNPEEHLDFFVILNKGLGKKMKVAALVGPELQERAQGVVDLVVSQTDFDKYKDKKETKKLADEYDYFIAQADIMPKVATVFGRVFGPRGKMPNPKLGSVLPGKAPVEPLYERLQKTVRIQAKKSPNVQVKIGNEAMKDEELAENVTQVFNQVLTNLPKERSNVKRVLLKTTMGQPVELDI